MSKRKRGNQNNNSEEDDSNRYQDSSSSEDLASSVAHDNEMDILEQLDERLQKRFRNGLEPSSGIIEEITLVNFMCHKHLSIKFGNNINFIVGQNGSGKSAILVGLTVGLGARAGFTNRGTKLANLVRQGANAAVITIKLRNTGVEAFKPSEYGESIIVERRITKEGTTSYRLRDATGKHTISTTASELTDILEQFNVQINNPCAILMQDTSRQFLAGAGPKEKYKFFLMATQLDQMERDFTEANVKIKEMASALTKKQKVVGDMEKAVLELQREYEELAQLRNMEGKMNDLKKMMAWALVREAFMDAEKVKSEIDKIKNESKKNTESKGELQKQLEKLKAEAENKKMHAETFQEKLQKLSEEKTELERNVSQLRKEVMQKQAVHGDNVKRASHLEARKKKMLEKLNEMKQQSNRDLTAERAKRQEDLTKKRQRLEDLKTERAQNEELEQEHDKVLAQLQEQVDRIRHDEDAKKQRISQYERALQNLEAQTRDKYRVYGNGIPQLLELINKNQHKFRRPPVGPVGALIKLKDDRWAAAIEVCISGKVMKSFILDNAGPDAQLFKQLCAQARCDALTIIHPFDDLYSIPENRYPDRNKFLVMADMIETDPLTEQMLFLQTQIHTKILVEDQRQGTEIMFAGRPPANVTECYTLDATRIFLAGSSQNIVPSKTGRKFIGVDYQKQIAETQETLKVLNTQLREISSQRQQADSQRRDQSRQLESVRDQIRKQQVLLTSLERDVRELENYKEPPQNDEAILSIEGDLKELEKEHESVISRQKEMLHAAKQSEEQLRPVQDQLNKKQAETDKLIEEQEGLQVSVAKTAADMARVENKLQAISKQHNDTEGKILKLMDDLKAKEKVYEETREKAKKFCAEEIEVTKSCIQIDKEIHALEVRIQQERQGRRSPHEVKQLFKEAKQKYERTRSTMKRLEELREVNLWKVILIEKRLENGLEKRIQLWSAFRASIARRTMMLFNYHLSQKGFNGTLDFDHRERTLNISVQLDSMRPKEQQKMMKDTKALSGGERSYSTVSFLLALWDAMETPFRAMDEFDVFMDAVNRQLSIELLIESARESANKQFIFITPHDYSMIKPGPDVRIHKMLPPQRGQSTLNFAPSQQE